MLRVATYNMRNLFDDYTVDGSSSPKPASEVRALVKSINALGAHVIGAQEVESLEALENVNNRLRSPYAHLKLVKGNSSRGIHLGFLSKYPFRTKSHKGTILTARNGRQLMEYASERDADRGYLTPLKFQRDCLRATVQTPDGSSLTIFNLHLKSQRDYSWMRLKASKVREAEARAAAKIIASEGGKVVVLGDFNEEHDKWPIKPLLSELGFYDPVQSEIVPQDPRAHTYHPYRYRGRIDYVLLSADAKLIYRRGSVRIHASSNARKASDHYPVSVKLNT